MRKALEAWGLYYKELIARSPDGKDLFAASYDNKVRRWDIKTGKLIQ